MTVALYEDEVTFEERVEAIQETIDTGTAWRLEGAIGREAMDLIEAGYCMLGPEGHSDFYGGYVPSRYEVAPGTPGSASYAEAKAALRDGGDD
jgi:hypothetical protein